MPDVFFKCVSCGKHLVIDGTGVGTKYNCPDCNDLVTIPTLVITRLCPKCKIEFMFSSGMTGERIYCTSCNNAVVLSPSLPQQGGSIPLVGGQACPKCNFRIWGKILVCSQCGYELLDDKRTSSKEKVINPFNGAGKAAAGSVIPFAMILIAAGIIFGCYKCSESVFSEQDREDAIRDQRRGDEGLDNVTARVGVQVYLDHTLNDPKSYQSVKWSEVVKFKELYVIQHSYRAKNSFGAYVIETRFFTLDSNAHVVSVSIGSD